MITGLTLGKYSLFHKGHQQLIDTALSEVDRLIIVIYNSPETTNIPLQVRSNWTRKIYPEVEVLEARDGPTEVGDTPEIMCKHDDYLKGLLKGRSINRFYTAEFYGDHISRALGAEFRESSRSEVKISGTQFHSSPYENRHMVHPVVYSPGVRYKR